ASSFSPPSSSSPPLPLPSSHFRWGRFAVPAGFLQGAYGYDGALLGLVFSAVFVAGGTGPVSGMALTALIGGFSGVLRIALDGLNRRVFNMPLFTISYNVLFVLFYRTAVLGAALSTLGSQVVGVKPNHVP